MRLVFIGLFGVLASLPAFAALSPYWERATEIQRIAGDDKVEKILKGGMIEAIRNVGVDQYIVTKGDCVLNIAITTVPNVSTFRAGPRNFVVEVTSSHGCD